VTWQVEVFPFEISEKSGEMTGYKMASDSAAEPDSPGNTYTQRVDLSMHNAHLKNSIGRRLSISFPSPSSICTKSARSVVPPLSTADHA